MTHPWEDEYDALQAFVQMVYDRGIAAAEAI